MEPIGIVTAVSGAAAWAWEAVGEELLTSLAKAAGSVSGKSAATASGQAAAKLWGAVKWKLAAADYRTRLSAVVGTTRLLFHPKPIDLSKIFTDVKVFDIDAAFRFSRMSLDDIMDLHAHEDSHPRRSALDAVKTGHHLYILGRPGAGKTTLLKHIALLACNGELDKTPVFIELRSCKIEIEDPILSAIHNEFAICNFPDSARFVDQLLNDGRAIVLVDGLDEVPEAEGTRKRIISDLTLLARKYPRAQFCVTCRIAATDYTFERFDYLEIADFSEEQKLIFAAKWFDGHPDRLRRFEAQWHAAQNAGLRGLGRTPLLLALICLTFEETLEIPRRQVDLYREAIDALLRKWDSSRNVVRDSFYLNLQPSRREHLLAEIAVEACARRRILFTVSEVTGQIVSWYSRLPAGGTISRDDAVAILRDIESQHGLLAQRAKEIYSFSHLSLQEFFAASAVVSGRFFSSTSEFVTKQFLASHWREVFVFACSLAPDASNLLMDMATECARVLDALPYSRALMNYVQELSLESDDVLRLPQLARTTRQGAALVPTSTAFVSLDHNDTSKILRCLEDIYEDLRSLGLDTARHDIGIVYDLIARFRPELAKTLGYARKGVEGVGTVSFVEFAESLRLLVQCASLSVCGNRAEVIRRAMYSSASVPTPGVLEER